MCFSLASVWAEAADFLRHVLHQHSIKLLVLTLHFLNLSTQSLTMFLMYTLTFFHIIIIFFIYI